MFDKQKGSKESAAPAPETRPNPPTPQPAAPTAQASAGGGSTAMIGRGISIAGDVSSDSNLRIEGVIKGNSVKSKHDVEIGESGKVTASISAKLVRIAGEVTGDVNGSEKVMIAKSGRVQGNVVAPRVQLEDGALFRGSIDMNPAEPADAKPNAPAPSKPTPVEASGGSKSAAPAGGTASEAVSGGPRKEPGLTLKSG
jgi:cytoskeletal protein CcmA (bactofilin family)